MFLQSSRIKLRCAKRMKNNDFFMESKQYYYYIHVYPDMHLGLLAYKLTVTFLYSESNVYMCSLLYQGRKSLFISMKMASSYC